MKVSIFAKDFEAKIFVQKSTLEPGGLYVSLGDTEVDHSFTCLFISKDQCKQLFRQLWEVLNESDIVKWTGPVDDD